MINKTEQQKALMPDQTRPRRGNKERKEFIKRVERTHLFIIPHRTQVLHCVFLSQVLREEETKRRKGNSR
jgi:hypothetical protein